MSRQPSHSRPWAPDGFRRQETSSSGGRALEFAGDVCEGHVGGNAASVRRSPFSIRIRRVAIQKFSGIAPGLTRQLNHE